MPLGTSHITTTTADAFRPEVWSMEVLRSTEDALVMAPLVKRFDDLVTKAGDVINIPNISNLTASAKSASTQVSLSAPTEANTQININQHQHVAFLLEDIVEVQSNYNLMAEYTNKAGFALAEKIDTDLLAEYSNFTNSDVGAYGDDITNAVVLAAQEAIALANAPVSERYMIIYPTQMTALLKIENFIKADWVGNYDQPTMIKTGVKSRWIWGNVYGIDVYYTKQVPQDSGTPTQTHNIMFQKEAIALALQQAPRTQTQYKLEYTGNLVVVDAIYGIKTIRTDFGVEIRS